jgi:hypothetical protein
MTSEGQTISMRRGTTRIIRIPIIDEDGGPLALTNYKGIWWGVWKSDAHKENWASALISKSKSGGEITLVNIDSVDDGVEFEINETDMAAHDLLGDYYHEIKGQDASDYEDVLSCGDFIVSPSPTRDRSV